MPTHDWSVALERCGDEERISYRLDVVVFPVWMNFMSEPPSFSERHTRSRTASSYMFHQVWLMNELYSRIQVNQKDRNTFGSFPTHLERLKQMLARRISLAMIHHRVWRKVGKPIIRFVFVVKQYLPATARPFSKQVPQAHSVGSGGSSWNDGQRIRSSRRCGRVSGGRCWCGCWVVCGVTAAAATTTVVTFPLSLVFSEFMATTDAGSPLASHLDLSLNLNLATIGAPPRIHPSLRQSPRLVRADVYKPRRSTLRRSMSMIGGMVLSVIWRCGVASISRLLFAIHLFPLLSPLISRIPLHK